MLFPVTFRGTLSTFELKADFHAAQASGNPLPIKVGESPDRSAKSFKNIDCAIAGHV